jgi:hypothetical protein
MVVKNTVLENITLKKKQYMKVIGMMKKIVVNNVLKEYNYNKKGEG